MSVLQLDAKGTTAIGGWIGLVASLVETLAFAYFVVQDAKVFRSNGGCCGYLTLRRGIRGLCLCFAAFDMPHFAEYAWNLDGVGLGIATIYSLHLIAQAALYAAFCYFSVLWVELLRFSPRVQRLATFLSMLVSSVYFVFSVIVAIECLLNPNLDKWALSAYRGMFFMSMTSLSAAAVVFLVYGFYLQTVLNSWYGSNSVWQRGVLKRVNQIVLSCTFACLLRTTMILLLWLEKSGKVSYEFFAGDGAEKHFIIWLLLSQVIPNGVLASVLFYMSRPATEAPGVQVFSESVVEQSPLPNSGEFDALGYPHQAHEEDAFASLLDRSNSVSRLSTQGEYIGVGGREEDDDSDGEYLSYDPPVSGYISTLSTQTRT